MTQEPIICLEKWTNTSNMIVVKVTGGLGNQLFQYAFGKYVALKNKTSLSINCSSLAGNRNDKDHRRRVMHLQDFKVSFKEVSNKELRDYLFITGNKLIDDYILLRMKKIHKKAFFEGFSDFKKLNEKELCLIGYFVQGEFDWYDKQTVTEHTDKIRMQQVGELEKEFEEKQSK